jgi:hypothetical protein
MPSLLELNRDILDAIRNLAFDACCHDLPFQPTPDQTTDLTPHEGPAPETWGSEPVADWDDWELLVCGAAGAWVDLQVDNARVMQTLLNVGAITIAVIIGFFAVFSLTAIILGTAASIWGGLATLYGTQVFSQAADAMEANRDKLICAIKGEYLSGLREAMEEITPTLAWIGWYQFQAYENIENTIWEGGNPNQGDLEVHRENCPDCEDFTEYEFDTMSIYKPGLTGAALTNVSRTGNTADGWTFTATSGNDNAVARMTTSTWRTAFDIPANFTVERFQLVGTTESEFGNRSLRVSYYSAGPITHNTDLDLGNNDTFDLVITPAEVTTSNNTWFLQITVFHNGETGNSDALHSLRLHSLRIAGSFTE